MTQFLSLVNIEQLRTRSNDKVKSLDYRPIIYERAKTHAGDQIESMQDGKKLEGKWIERVFDVNVKATMKWGQIHGVGQRLHILQGMHQVLHIEPMTYESLQIVSLDENSLLMTDNSKAD